MRPTTILLLIITTATILRSVPSIGAELAELPQGGTQAIDKPLGRYSNGGEVSLSEADGIYTARIDKTPKHPWEVGFAQSTCIDVHKDDVMAVEFTASGRGLLAPEGYVNVVFERNGPPNEKSIETTVSVGSDQRRYVLPFKARDTYAAGQAQISIRFGEVPQEITITNVRLLNYGDRVKLEDLPITRVEYPGMEDDAPWRKEALARIDQIRKGNLTVTVLDSAGEPVPNAEVKMDMTRQQFRFGTCAPAYRLIDDSPDNQTFRKVLLSDFNYVTLENDLKWTQYQKNPELAKRALQWLGTNGIDARGHNLIWPGWTNGFFPAKLAAEYKTRKSVNPNDAKAWLRETCDKRVLSTTQDLAGLVRDWDVVNEPYANHDVMDELGQNVMIDWFKLAHQGDPNANLYLNDYGILEGRGKDTKHIDAFIHDIQFIKDNGGPIGGIGIQGHFSSALTGPEKMLEILDRLAALGLPIQITEFDINIEDEKTQAEFTRDLLITIYSHPSTDAFIMWGFWEKSHWLPKGAMYHADWSPKPNAKVWQDWVLGKWWTHETVQSNVAGIAEARGFAGSYKITATANGKSATFEAHLPTSGAKVEIKLP